MEALTNSLYNNAVDAAEVAARAATTEGSGTASSTALEEFNQDVFWSFMKEADEAGKLVVVDFYTDWCGSCVSQIEERDVTFLSESPAKNATPV